MNSVQAGRPGPAKLFLAIVQIIPLVVVLQAVLIGVGLYEKRDFVDVHAWVGFLGSILVVIILPALVFAARFPASSGYRRLTLVLAGLWLFQFLIGPDIKDMPWIAPIHIPNAFFIFGVSLVLAMRARRDRSA